MLYQQAQPTAAAQAAHHAAIPYQYPADDSNSYESELQSQLQNQPLQMSLPQQQTTSDKKQTFSEKKTEV
jgi:hypothetical protein